ncbi:MAG: phasin family protein [Sphingobium sp.]
MTGTTKAPRRSTPATVQKAAAKPAAARAAVRSTSPKKPEAAISEPVVQEVAELTAADLAVSQEPKEPKEKPSAPVVTAKSEEIAPTAIEEVAVIAEEVEQKGIKVMSDVMETTKKYTDEAKERFQSAFSEMSEKAKTSVEKSTKAFEELSDLAKGNVEALVESGKIATKGVEALGQEAAEYGRTSFEKASAAMKSLAAVKSPTEFFQLQSDLMSSSFDAFAKESAKASEAFLKLAGDVVQPISTRVSVVTDKVRSLAA